MIYNYRIENEFFGSFSGRIEADTKKEAKNNLKDFYAIELDTTSDEIEVEILN